MGLGSLWVVCCRASEVASGFGPDAVEEMRVEACPVRAPSCFADLIIGLMTLRVWDSVNHGPGMHGLDGR